MKTQKATILHDGYYPALSPQIHSIPIAFMELDFAMRPSVLFLSNIY